MKRVDRVLGVLTFAYVVASRYGYIKGWQDCIETMEKQNKKAAARMRHR
jgi:hypothetical protein